MVRVKICGITNRTDAECAALHGADAIGFIFAKSQRKISLATATEISKTVGPWMTTVGVFVDEKLDTVLKTVETCRLSAVQLHGKETAAYIQKLLKRSVHVIKTFHVGSAFDWEAARDSDADALLFDTEMPGMAGGSGQPFKWSVLEKRKFPKPMIVSGGLKPGNVWEMVQKLSPYGVDVSSGVERSPGKKDHEFIKEFIFNAKKQF